MKGNPVYGQEENKGFMTLYIILITIDFSDEHIWCISMTPTYTAVPPGVYASETMFVYGFLIMKPAEFLKIINRLGRDAVVVLAVKNEGVVRKRKTYIYAAKYGGFTVLTRSEKPLPLRSDVELVVAEHVVLPVAVRSRLNSLK